MSSSVTCSNGTFGDPDPGHSKACWYGPPAQLGSGEIAAVGGSNYPFYVQNFGTWDTNERVLIGTYHLDPTLVQAQLQQLYKSGQRKISLFLWYMPFIDSETPIAGQTSQWPDVWVAWMNSSGGSLSPQTQQNLTAICGLIKQIGFQEVTLRFAPIGAIANPTSWGNTWNEAAFQEDEAFIFNTRQLMEAALGGSSVSRTYDLGVEMGGIPHYPNADGVTYTDGQSPEWTTRLWADYIASYGHADSYGFSMSYSFGVLTRAMSEFDMAGTRPDYYAIDLAAATDLWNYYQELEGGDDEEKPVVIQEVDYNDQGLGQGIATELQHIPLTIAYIDQFPASSANPTEDGMIAPTDYGAYGGSSTASGTIVVAPCTPAVGQTTCSTQATWSTSNAANVALYVNGVQALNAANITTTLTGSATVTLGLTPSTFVLVSNQGSLSQSTLVTLLVGAANQSAPQITSAGLGGTNNQSLWALGSNIATNCIIELLDPNLTGPSPLATVSNANCGASALSFAIPTSVLANYSAVNLVVINPGSQASAPYYVRLQIAPTLSLAGSNGTEIWANGSNFSSGCTVQLYDLSSAASTPFATINTVSCTSSQLTLQVPAFVLANYTTLTMTVTNSDGQTSAPLTFPLPGAIPSVCTGLILSGTNSLVGHTPRCR